MGENTVNYSLSMIFPQSSERRFKILKLSSLIGGGLI
jgi:hypothetical protein